MAREFDSDTIAMLFDMGPAVKTTEDFGKALNKVGDAAFVAENALRKVDDQADRVGVQIGTFKVNVDQADRALMKLADGTEKAAASNRNMGRTALESGRILQDFSQGGIGGILNNIEGLSMALGGGPGLAGIMTAVGLAAFFAAPAIKTLWKTITDGANEIPTTRGHVEELNDRLATNKTRLEELKKEQALSNKELAEFNRLLAEQPGLERAITAARALNAPSKAQKGPGEDINKAIGQFGGDRVRKAIEDALVNARGDFGPAANKQFTDQFVGNVMAGDQGAITMLRDIMRGRGGPVNRAIRGEDPFPGNGNGLTPAEQARRDKAVEDRRKAELAAAEGMNRDVELTEAQTAARKATEAGKSSRAATKDVAEKTKAVGQQRKDLGSADVKARQEIARLQEDQHQAKMMLGQGLATFEATQNTVARDQAMIAQLQQQLQRIQQRERELQGRQTLLQRGR